MWVFSPNGQIYQPVGGHSPAWPRYNLLTGEGNDADVNGAGQTGYGTVLYKYAYNHHRLFNAIILTLAESINSNFPGSNLNNSFC